MRYNIPVENIEELRKAATRIQKKANKHGCKVVFEEVDEIFKTETDEDGNEVTRKYIVVEAEGEAKAEGWVFAGTIEHTKAGNILRSVSDEYKIPERYRDAEPYCEHCNTKRYRKDTYVVYNEETGEFKQLGKSCLKEYTNGLSLEMTACVLKWLKDVEEHCYYGGGSFKPFWEVKEVSRYFVETMRKFGWASSSAGESSTKNLAMNFYDLEHGTCRLFKEEIKKYTELAENVDFNVNHVEEEYIEAALEWARNWDGHEWNDYRENLKVIAQLDYCEWKHLGYLASLFMAYDKEMEREVKRMERKNSRAQSKHIGEVKEKITCSVKEFKCLTSWETQWGVTFLYEFITEEGNILIWKTGKWIDEDREITIITGTVKAHNEFRGAKQTELTRCKVA